MLRNKFTQPGKPYGESDPTKLRALEEAAAVIRLEELAKHPIRGRFDYEHRKAIHRCIFQDVYEWAGQERVAPVGEFMTKAGPDVVRYPVGDPAAPQVTYQYYPAGLALSEAAEEQWSVPEKVDTRYAASWSIFVYPNSNSSTVKYPRYECLLVRL
jgi:cell filamentation protein